MPDIKLSKPEEVKTKDGVVTLAYDRDDFLKNAEDPEGLKKAFKYISDYTTAVTEDTVKHAAKVFKKNKDATEVITTSGFGGVKTDKFTVRVQKEYKGPMSSEAKPRISTKIASRSFPGKSMLQKQRDALMEELG